MVFVGSKKIIGCLVAERQGLQDTEAQVDCDCDWLISPIRAEVMSLGQTHKITATSNYPFPEPWRWRSWE